MDGDGWCGFWNRTGQLRRVWFITSNHVFKRHHSREISYFYVTDSSGSDKTLYTPNRTW
jgi:hypothetical protein